MQKNIYGQLILILIIVGFLGVREERGCGIPSGPPELIQAIADLSSDDYVIVRKGIFTIEKNLSSPNILMVVTPLIEVAKNSNGRRDAYTRCLAVPVLFRIGINHPKTGPGKKAISAVIYLLHNSPADLVRGTCANAIGVAGYEPGISDLEQALNDSSVYVQQESCLALLRITNYTYSSEKCNPWPEQSSIQTLSAMSSESGKVANVNNWTDPDAVYRWFRSHLLFPLPNNNGGQLGGGEQ